MISRRRRPGGGGAATRVDRVAAARAPAADRWRPSPRAIDARVFRRLAEDRGVAVAPRFHICELTLDSGLHHLGRLAARRRSSDRVVVRAVTMSDRHARMSTCELSFGEPIAGDQGELGCDSSLPPVPTTSSTRLHTCSKAHTRGAQSGSASGGKTLASQLCRGRNANSRHPPLGVTARSWYLLNHIPRRQRLCKTVACHEANPTDCPRRSAVRVPAHEDAAAALRIDKR